MLLSDYFQQQQVALPTCNPVQAKEELAKSASIWLVSGAGAAAGREVLWGLAEHEQSATSWPGDPG